MSSERVNSFSTPYLTGIKEYRVNTPRMINVNNAMNEIKTALFLIIDSTTSLFNHIHYCFSVFIKITTASTSFSVKKSPHGGI